MRSAKSLGFCLRQEKNKSNKKLLLRACRNGNYFSAPTLLIAWALAVIKKSNMSILKLK
jgi:hypothetical protein